MNKLQLSNWINLLHEIATTQQHNIFTAWTNYNSATKYLQHELTTTQQLNIFTAWTNYNTATKYIYSMN